MKTPITAKAKQNIYWRISLFCDDIDRVNAGLFVALNGAKQGKFDKHNTLLNSSHKQIDHRREALLPHSEQSDQRERIHNI